MQIFTITVATSAVDTPTSVSTKVFTDKKVAREHFKTRIEEAEGDIETQTSNSCTLFDDFEFDADTQIDFLTHIVKVGDQKGILVIHTYITDCDADGTINEYRYTESQYKQFKAALEAEEDDEWVEGSTPFAADQVTSHKGKVAITHYVVITSRYSIPDDSTCSAPASHDIGNLKKLG